MESRQQDRVGLHAWQQRLHAAGARQEAGQRTADRVGQAARLALADEAGNGISSSADIAFARDTATGHRDALNPYAEDAADLAHAEACQRSDATGAAITQSSRLIEQGGSGCPVLCGQTQMPPKLFEVEQLQFERVFGAPNRAGMFAAPLPLMRGARHVFQGPLDSRIDTRWD